MINSSIFTYLPPFKKDNPRGFLGFSRFEKEDQVPDESWDKIASLVSEKVFDTIREKYDICTCCVDSIQFAGDGTEVGIVLKRVELPGVRPLFEIVDETQPTTNTNYPKEFIERIRANSLNHLYNKSLEDSSSIDPKQLRQMELNEFAITKLCEMSIEAGIDKQSLLKQVQQARNNGYLSSQSFYKMQLTIFKS